MCACARNCGWARIAWRCMAWHGMAWQCNTCTTGGRALWRGPVRGARGSRLPLLAVIPRDKGRASLAGRSGDGAVRWEKAGPLQRGRSAQTGPLPGVFSQLCSNLVLGQGVEKPPHFGRRRYSDRGNGRCNGPKRLYAALFLAHCSAPFAPCSGPSVSEGRDRAVGAFGESWRRKFRR